MTLPYFSMLIFIFDPNLRININMDDGFVLLMFLTLYNFYFMFDDMARYIDKNFELILTLHTDDTNPSYSPICYKDISKFNFGTLLWVP